LRCLASDNAIDAKRLRRKVLFLKLDERKNSFLYMTLSQAIDLFSFEVLNMVKLIKIIFKRKQNGSEIMRKVTKLEIINANNLLLIKISFYFPLIHISLTTSHTVTYWWNFFSHWLFWFEKRRKISLSFVDTQRDRWSHNFTFYYRRARSSLKCATV
jgi:hypothetical protein